MPFPISLTSFLAKPETIRLALATFATSVSSGTLPGRRERAYSVFLLGRVTTGVATQTARAGRRVEPDRASASRQPHP